jgi:hypothetical protein
MGRRSENLFRRNDVMRAIKSARDAGLPVAGIEITCKDGTVIKVLGDAAAVKQWGDAPMKLKEARTTAKPKASP